MQLHGMGQFGFPKISDFPRGANMLPAFVKLPLLTLGVDAKGSTCPGNLTSGQFVSLHILTGDRISSSLPGRSIKVPAFGKGQGTLSVETGTIVSLDTSRWVGTIGWGEW